MLTTMAEDAENNRYSRYQRYGVYCNKARRQGVKVMTFEEFKQDEKTKRVERVAQWSIEKYGG